MDSVSVFDGLRVAQVETCERWVLKYEVKYLLLESATIDRVVFKGQ